MKKDSQDNEFFDIDEHQLDVEWNRQIKMRRKYSERLADAKRDAKQAKAEFKLIEAELDLQIRDNPSLFHIKKVTEPAIANVIITQKEYQQAQRELINAEHKSDVLSGIIDTIDDRKYGLQDRVKLFLADYFGDPKTDSANGREKIEEMRRRRLLKPIKKVVHSDD